MNSTLSPGESSRSVNFVKPTFKRTMKNLYGKKGESSGGSGGKQKSGMQKGLKCRRCGLRGHIGENCQVRCHICKRIGHISKNCKQNSIVHNIEQGESSSESYEFGMDENCENALDNELYPEYDHDNECNSVEIEKGNANTCSYLCADFSKLTHLTDSKSSNMYVRDKVFNAFDFSYLVCDPDSTITTDKSDLSLVSDNVFPNVNMIELSKPYVEVEINGKLLSMEFDSGSAVSVVSKRTLLSCGLANLTLTPSRQTLRVANGQIKTVDGCAVVNVELNGEKAHGMQLYVAEDFPSLFGRPWIVKFCGQNWLEKLLSTKLPKSVTHPVRERDEFGDMFALTMSETLLNAELVANDTRKDPILSRVLEYTLNGWPKNLKCDGDLKAFWTRRDELSHELGCLTWGARVVIPAKLRSTVMDILHATHIGVTGIPICLVTDNGPQFVSDETEGYLKSCGIKHVTVPTYSPKSNGICERLVQSFKSALKKMSVTSKDVCKNLNDFLLTYRNTPHSSTGQTPAVLAFNRTLRSKLHQIKPTDRMREQELQSEKLQVAINEHPRTREFRENQLIFAKMDDKSHWEQARVIKRLGDNSNNYVVQHADAIKPQKTLLTREIARSDIKFQKLHETRERRRMNALNLGVPNGNRLEAVAKPASPVKDTSPAKVTERPQPKVASPLKTNDKQVRVSELSKPTATGGAPLPEPRLGPTRSAKSDAITKMKTMS
ncbi:uncharacterized protein LOC134823403 isoform X2 [Bolinopsis microptera]|uniref:uncharacterized protein LOC134823403 isoform X2 n=1 Tax=Bolinopsis microptera TaxID=2820187 RepID=UPI003078C9C2